MILDRTRVLLRDLGVDLAPRVDSSTGGKAAQMDASDLLSDLVVLLVGRGSPEQVAVNRALKTAGAVVLVKTSAAEVIQMLRAFVPSVVVTEVRSDDDAGGLAVLQAIRNLPPDHGGELPIVGICARTTDAAPTIRAGFQEALVGPFEAGDVGRTILRALHRPS